MATLLATLIVNFDTGGIDGDGGLSFSLAIDDRPQADGGLNDGKTSGFFYGESVFILLFRNPLIRIRSFGATAGTLTRLGTGQYAVANEKISFIETDTASLARPYATGLVHQWMGNDLGSPTVVESETLKIGVDDQVGVLVASYNAPYDVFKLDNVKESDFAGISPGQNESIAWVKGEF